MSVVARVTALLNFDVDNTGARRYEAELEKARAATKKAITQKLELDKSNLERGLKIADDDVRRAQDKFDRQVITVAAKVDLERLRKDLAQAKADVEEYDKRIAKSSSDRLKALQAEAKAQKAASDERKREITEIKAEAALVASVSRQRIAQNEQEVRAIEERAATERAEKGRVTKQTQQALRDAALLRAEAKAENALLVERKANLDLVVRTMERDNAVTHEQARAAEDIVRAEEKSQAASVRSLQGWRTRTEAIRVSKQAELDAATEVVAAQKRVEDAERSLSQVRRAGDAQDARIHSANHIRATQEVRDAKEAEQAAAAALKAVERAGSNRGGGSDKSGLAGLIAGLPNVLSGASKLRTSFLGVSGTLTTIATAAAFAYQPLLALAGAITAIVGSAAAATAGLGALAVGLAALVAPIGVLGIAIGQRVGLMQKAWQALTKETDATGKASAASAKKQTSAADQIVSAQEQMKTAELGLAQAHRDVNKAQSDLTDARFQAARQLQDLSIAEDHSALAGKRADLSLREALVALVKVQNDPKADRFALDEAKLAVADAREGVKGASVDQKRAHEDTKRGVDTVKTAEEQLATARRGVATANRQVADANRAVTKAQQGSADALAGTSTQAQNADVALGKLTKTEKTLLKNLRTFVDSFTKTMKPATDAVFKGVSSALTSLTPVIATFKDDFKGLGTTIGKVISDGAKSLGGPEWTSAFAAFTDTANKVIKPLSHAIGEVFTGFRNIAVAAGPLVVQFVKDLDKFITNIVNKTKNIHTVRGVIKDLVDEMDDWLTLIGQVGTLLFSVLSGGATHGRHLVVELTNVLKKWNAFLDSKEGQERMRKFFDHSITLLTNIGNFVLGVKDGFTKTWGVVKSILESINDAFGGVFRAMVGLIERITGASIDLDKHANGWKILGEVLGGIALLKLTHITDLMKLLLKVGGAGGAIKGALGALFGIDKLKGSGGGGGGGGGVVSQLLSKQGAVPDKPLFVWVVNEKPGGGGGPGGGVLGKVKGIVPRIVPAGAGVAAGAAAAAGAAVVVTAIVTTKISNKREVDSFNKQLERLVSKGNVKGIQDLRKEFEKYSSFPGGIDKATKALDRAVDAAKRVAAIQKLFGPHTRIKAADIVDPQATTQVIDGIKALKDGSSSNIDDLKARLKFNMKEIKAAFVDGSHASKAAMIDNFGAGITAVKKGMADGSISVKDGMKEIRSITHSEMQFARDNMDTLSDQGREKLGQHFRDAAAAVQRQMDAAGKTTRAGMRDIRTYLTAELKLFGFSISEARNIAGGHRFDGGKNEGAGTVGPNGQFITPGTGQQRGGRVELASGGWLGGRGALGSDTIPLGNNNWAAAGEYYAKGPGGGGAIINRHQAPFVEAALMAGGHTLDSLPRTTSALPMIESAMGGAGGLDMLFEAINRPHMYASGGRYKGVSGDTDFSPILGRALSALAKAAGQRIFVQSGKRTVAEQLALGPGTPQHPVAGINGPHVRGIAADITPGFPVFSKLASRFGLGFTVMPQEPWHIQLTDTSKARRAQHIAKIPPIGVKGGGAVGAAVAGGLDLGRAVAQRLLNRAARSADGGGGDGSSAKPLGADANVIAAFRRAIKSTGANPKERLGLWEAGIVESGLRNLQFGDADSLGALQERTSIFGRAHALNPYASAVRFLQDAISKRPWRGTAGTLAQAVQRSNFPAKYDAVAGAARKYLQRGGLFSSGGVATRPRAWGGRGSKVKATSRVDKAPVSIDQYLRMAFTDADAWWKAQGTPPPPLELTYGTLPPGATPGAEAWGWYNSGHVQMNTERFPKDYEGIHTIKALAGKRSTLSRLWALAAHERGHNLGYQHTPDGIMRPDLRDIPGRAFTWAAQLLPKLKKKHHLVGGRMNFAPGGRFVPGSGAVASASPGHLKSPKQRIRAYDNIVAKVAKKADRYDYLDRKFSQSTETFVDPVTGALDQKQIAKRVRELDQLLALRQDIVTWLDKAVQAVRAIITSYKEAIKRMKNARKGANKKQRKGLDAGIAADQDAIKAWRDETLPDAKKNLRDAKLDVIDVRNERAGVIGTKPEGQAAEDATPATPLDYLNAAIAQAGLTPGTADDITAAQNLVNYDQGVYNAAVASGDPRKITQAANDLAAAKAGLASAGGEGAGITPDVQAQLDQLATLKQIVKTGDFYNAAAAQTLKGDPNTVGDKGAAPPAQSRQAQMIHDALAAVGPGRKVGTLNEGGIVIHQTVNTLHPGDPKTLLAVGRAVVEGVGYQGAVQSPRQVTGI